ncbi:Ubiquitin family protein isoform 1 [Hibiscus syriacus]|uniref:Ubiquitin family protein isoform 1 n=1 Tax=Hibiscus syriacus TaxID=106335 RepID=A0A6A2YG50_HIBSY|nr:Ubiquitin family protein isoform 1 [Hibiscus syriacus]
MGQQTIDSKISEYGLRNPENNSATCDKQPLVGAKKTPLRDLQNEHRTVPYSTGSSSISKDRGLATDPAKVSGTKRPSPECPVSPSHCQSPSTSSINGHLVYVRRKPEAELGKNCAFNCSSMNNCQRLRHASQMASSTSSSYKPSMPLPPGKPATGLAPLESNQHTVVSATPGLDSPKGTMKLHFEERYYQLQMLLKKLDQSDLEDYAQIEQSKQAVELEKRSIQLSLEEAKELQRAAILNVLGKNMKMDKAQPSNQSDHSYK